jgi:hypothetical protein
MMKNVLFCLLSLIFCACSIQKMAIRSVADALTEGTAGTFAADDDPILVGEALPFALKTMEALLQAAPEHQKLLIATASGFVQYAHAYVLWPANKLEYTNLADAKKGRERAKGLFLRARDYGIRALDLDHPNFNNALYQDPKSAAALAKKRDVAALYWTGVAWASALSVSKNDMSLVADLPIIEAIMTRALALDADWGNGALYEFFIVFDAGRSAADGGGIEKAENHFQRAMDLNGGESVGPLVSAAEAICVRQQDRGRFKELLHQVLEFNLDKHSPHYRLSNIIAKQKAEFLLANIDNLFIADDKDIQ